MNVSRNLLRPSLGVALIVMLCVVSALAQQARGTLRGVIKDELGATIVGATVTITDAGGVKKATTTNNDGAYVLNGLAPGKYLLTASATGFALAEEAEVNVAAGQRQTLDVTLQVTIEEQNVTIASETPLSTEASNNANQTLITGKDLDALPDDPDELAAALQALAGPSMGPNGGQILVDGFSGGRLPPKESIREIRINQNPFAAENDQASGRIEILTRPGTDKLRGSAFFNFEDESLNSRNPFSDSRTPFQVRQYGGNLGGPIVQKKASFFIDFQQRVTDDNELVNATVLDDITNEPLQLGFGVVTPRRNLNFSPRLDYQINTNNTLIVRYSYNRSKSENSGVGGFSLPERAYDTASTQQTFTVTETAILNASMINETRFQFNRNRNESLGDNTIPTLNVSGSFISGGSQVGHLVNSNTSWELQNFLAWGKNNHAFKFGGRVRGVRISDSNPNNFGGTYVFAGGFAPVLGADNNIIDKTVFEPLNSFKRYQRTVLLQEAGFDALQIRQRGGGAAQFSINAGNPLASVKQIDAGFYAQDDWRVRPNLTLGLGLRYENQTNIKSAFNFAPRAFMAWSPGAGDSARPPNMVIRAGAGIFYNRFGEINTLNANRYNGVNQQQFFSSEAPLYQDVNGVLTYVEPTESAVDAFDPTDPTKLPSPSQLTAGSQITWRVSDDLQAPRVYVAGVQVERQLPYRFTMFAGFYTIHVRNVVRARDINAPLPGSITNTNPAGTRPFGNVGEIYQYESTGQFDQNQFFVGFNNRLNRVISFSSNYSMSKSKNDTDGQGSGLFPADSYDLSGEYGRAGFDVRHRFSFFGTINMPWQVSLNPFVTYSSGRPFNIITGEDSNGDRQFTERPSFAPEGVDCNNRPAGIVCTKFGNFNLNPQPGEPLIPRNLGEGPGYFSVNMRISKTWNFGSMPASRAATQRGQQPAAAANARGGQDGPGGGVPRVPGAGGGGPQGGGGGRGGGGIPGGGIPGGGPGGGGGEAKRYSMVFSLNFNNILNKVNLSNPVGNLSSPSFGESLSLGGSFGGFGGFGGGSTGAGNRRVTAQVRFNF